MTNTRTPAHIRVNRRIWETSSDAYQSAHGHTLLGRPAWGSWRVPESELNVLGETRGLDVLELGCGGGQWSAHLAAEGARVIGLDLSRRQLEHAVRHFGSRGVSVPLTQADAEHLPFASETFDVVFSDYGAMSFADPERTVPEAARLLRPGGLLAFLTDSPWLHACWPDGQEHVSEHLVADYFGVTRIGEQVMEFTRPYGEWLRLFLRHGLDIDDLIEPRPAADAVSTFRSARERDWARRWPSESIWKVRKRR